MRQRAVRAAWVKWLLRCPLTLKCADLEFSQLALVG